MRPKQLKLRLAYLEKHSPGILGAELLEERGNSLAGTAPAEIQRKYDITYLPTHRQRSLKDTQENNKSLLSRLHRKLYLNHDFLNKISSSL